MKKITLLIGFLSVSIYSQSIFINEIHYDNVGTDVNEAIEIAGPEGTDLSNYSLEFYRDVGTVYNTLNLSGIITDQQDGFGTLSFAISGIQNGPADGFALVNGTTVVQFLSYEGTLTASEGAALGMTSTDISVAETSSTLATESLQLTGSGLDYTDFVWQTASVATQGNINTAQTFNNPTLSSLEAQLIKSSLDISPNPSSNGGVTFINKLQEEVKVVIYNNLGVAIIQLIVKGVKTISTENLIAGIYFVQLSTESGVVTKRLVIL